MADFKDTNTELSGFYSSAFELKNAEINLAAIAKWSAADESSKFPYVETQIESFRSSTERAVVQSYGMFTPTLNFLKQGLSKLKELIIQGRESIKGLGSKIKEKAVGAFTSVLEYFYRLITEFLGRMFSFIQMIGASKGFDLKSVGVSFDPPSFETVSFFGFPVCFQRFHYLKLTLILILLRQHPKQIRRQV